MKMILCILLLAFMCQPALASDWTKEDTAWQAAFLTTLSVDYLQTRSFTHEHRISNEQSGFDEWNPIIGRHPHSDKVDFYFLASGAAHTYIAYKLPPKYRRIWQAFFFGMEIKTVAHNYSAGVRIVF